MENGVSRRKTIKCQKHQSFNQTTHMTKVKHAYHNSRKLTQLRATSKEYMKISKRNSQ